MFSAIGDALARDEPVTIAGFGKFIMRSRARPPGPQPPNRGARRHRGLEGAVVQGGKGPSRRGQRIGWRDKRPGACPSSRQCRHGTRAHSHTPAPKPTGDTPALASDRSEKPRLRRCVGDKRCSLRARPGRRRPAPAGSPRCLWQGGEVGTSSVRRPCPQPRSHA